MTAERVPGQPFIHDATRGIGLEQHVLVTAIATITTPLEVAEFIPYYIELLRDSNDPATQRDPFGVAVQDMVCVLINNGDVKKSEMWENIVRQFAVQNSTFIQ